MTRDFAKKDDKKQAVKLAIRRLHMGEDPVKVKEECRSLLGSLEPVEIGMIEQELIDEGLPREEVHRMCDIHLEMFAEGFGKAEPKLPKWHPVFILMQEHELMLGFAEKLRNIATELKLSKGFELVKDTMARLEDVLDHLRESENHYLREENVLFPHLEKHGIKEPPAVMWMEHDRIREIKKGLFSLLEEREGMRFKDFTAQLDSKGKTLREALTQHFTKENNILFPMGLSTIEEKEWRFIRKEFDGLGYCCFTPEVPKVDFDDGEEEMAAAETATRAGVEGETEGGRETGAVEGAVPLETGTLTFEELEAMLNALPVDITYVDKDDAVRYFSQGRDRIFVRTKSVIGRSVQQCHPEKSVHVVNKILDDFRNGARDVAEFWIDLKGRLVHIRYFPMRGKDGGYLGCVEVTQDVTDIKKLEGEKRLLGQS